MNFIAIIIIIITIIINGKLQRQETQTQPHPPPGNCHAISDKSKIKVRLLSASVPFEVNAGLFFWPWNFYPKSNSPLAIACLFERVHQLHGVLRGEVTNAEDKIIELYPITLPRREICIGL